MQMHHNKTQVAYKAWRRCTKAESDRVSTVHRMFSWRLKVNEDLAVICYQSSRVIKLMTRTNTKVQVTFEFVKNNNTTNLQSST